MFGHEPPLTFFYTTSVSYCAKSIYEGLFGLGSFTTVQSSGQTLHLVHKTLTKGANSSSTNGETKCQRGYLDFSVVQQTMGGPLKWVECLNNFVESQKLFYTKLSPTSAETQWTTCGVVSEGRG